MAGFSLRTEDEGMPGLLVKMSVIILHLLHDGVMDGSYGSSLLYGSVENWFVVCHHFGCGGTCSLQGHFFWQSRYS